MSLIKNIQDKNFVAVKDYCEERIASIVAGKIQQKKAEFIGKVRGISEMDAPDADEKEDKKEKDPDKDGDDDTNKDGDTDKDGGQGKKKDDK